MKLYRTGKRGKGILLPVLLLCLMVLLGTGCGNRTADGQGQDASSGTASSAPAVSAVSGEETGDGQAEEALSASSDGEQEDLTGQTGDGAQDPGAGDSEDASDAYDEDRQIDEYGSYTSAEDVALYLHTYGRLPENFITKNEARALGWNGGSLEEYAPGMCIGGDRFGNREGVLPYGNYHECDIDTLGRSKRGSRRIVYDDEGNIYYTEDHYETFTLLYEAE